MFEDDFQNLLKVNQSLTTAKVETSDGGYVMLPKQPLPSALSMKEFGEAYAVVTSDGPRFYQYNPATNTVEYRADLSPPPIPNARGVALRQDMQSMWALTKTELLRYDYGGASMIYNPFLSYAGLSSVIAVTAHSTEDAAAVLSESVSGTGVISWYGTISDSFDTGIPNARSISMVPGTFDLVLTTDDAAYYFSYGINSPNPFLSFTGQSNIIGVSAQAADTETGYLLLYSAENRYVVFDGTGSMLTVDAVSQNSIERSIAVSLRPGTYDRALLTEDGTVQYWSWTGAELIRIPFLEITGLDLIKQYTSQAEYYSVVINTSEQYSALLLSVEEDNPIETQVTYQISPEEGIWVDIVPGTWLELLDESNRFILRAMLNTNDKEITPRIFSVRIEASKLAIELFQTTEIVREPPGNPPLPTELPVQVTAGYSFSVLVVTSRAEIVWLEFSNGEIKFLNEEEQNTFTGTYFFPLDTPVGTTFDLTVYAEGGGKQVSRSYPTHYHIADNIINNLVVYDSK